jgi:hypothetical protein
MHAKPLSEEDEEAPLDEAPLDEAPLDEAPLDEAPLDDEEEEEGSMGADKAFHRSATLGNEKLIQK